jgi:hypothetical protein
VLTPSKTSRDGDLDFEGMILTTTKGPFLFPPSVVTKERIDEFMALVETGLKGGLDAARFAGLLRQRSRLDPEDEQPLLAVYEKIKALEDRGENGIWARYIKNAFAPLYIGTFNFVIGNPPWIRWGYLSDEYRERTLSLWKGYGLFSLKGHEARLGGGEKDFSMLFTYAVCDSYLKEGGTCAFLITAEVFKSKGAGEGFRAFIIPQQKMSLKVLFMEDMVDLKPFQAANKTALFALRKGEATKYPVPVCIWSRRKGTGSIPPDWSIDGVRAHAVVREVKAYPIDPDKPTSAWQTAESALIRKTRKIQ